jgi:hypothetical protein
MILADPGEYLPRRAVLDLLLMGDRLQLDLAIIRFS